MQLWIGTSQNKNIALNKSPPLPSLARQYRDNQMPLQPNGFHCDLTITRETTESAYVMYVCMQITQCGGKEDNFFYVILTWTVHLWGFSVLCVRMCALSLPVVGYSLPQVGHSCLKQKQCVCVRTMISFFSYHPSTVGYSSQNGPHYLPIKRRQSIPLCQSYHWESQPLLG